VVPEDYFTQEADPVWGGTTDTFDMTLVDKLRGGRIEGHTDFEAAMALAALVHDELIAFGTAGGEKLTDEQMTAALGALRSVAKRLGIEFDSPYRNFTTFRSYWMRRGASGAGGWQARRDLLEELFGPLHLQLARIQEQAFEALAYPVSPHVEVGWPLVDEEVRELRRRFQTASTPQDYRAIGTHCVGVLEALGRTVYDAARHLRDGETPPPIDKTKQRIGRFVEDALPGERNEDVRGLANKAIELAHHVKHSPTPTRREAGISADAVILLANILRRLEQDL
jgi:hypothetical protein